MWKSIISDVGLKPELPSSAPGIPHTQPQNTIDNSATKGESLRVRP
ncbi:hypothetical protein MC7420_7558 [Coleofasciculus chthonoplastes PCC 7420]|uniref:Uncharacterized protein n=1 Tax=Coleofasciculus chthonoplastes PCC 7420 TaxID=118168 RepID=B4W173_9CYAN|nr:hypothetical protein MC7420_7558 [Coleofasciculus chthonoplastes PCC 7420]